MLLGVSNESETFPMYLGFYSKVLLGYIVSDNSADGKWITQSAYEKKKITLLSLFFLANKIFQMI